MLTSEVQEQRAAYRLNNNLNGRVPNTKLKNMKVTQRRERETTTFVSPLPQQLAIDC